MYKIIILTHLCGLNNPWCDLLGSPTQLAKLWWGKRRHASPLCRLSGEVGGIRCDRIAERAHTFTHLCGFIVTFFVVSHTMRVSIRPS